MTKRRIAIGAMLISTPVVGVTAAETCGTYPAGVIGISDCDLRRAGEKPLWHGLPSPDLRQQIRFTFSEGHGFYTKMIDFEEQIGGGGTIRLRTIHRRPGSGWTVSLAKKRRVTPVDVSTIDRLGRLPGTWEHRIGSWDGDAFFLHCETLDMERSSRADYSFTTVAISCNQPEKLMPLVNFITGLVNLKPYADRQMF